MLFPTSKPVTCSSSVMVSLLPPSLVGSENITELFFFNEVVASLNLELISILMSWPVCRISGVKKRYRAFEMATLIGSMGSIGSSSLKAETSG